MKTTTLLIGTLLFSLLQTESADAEESTGFRVTVQPFFAKYCTRCHDAKKQEGEFRLDTLAGDFSDSMVAQRWGEVLFRVNAGEMPPKGERQPSFAELGELADWISRRIEERRAARMARRGPVSHYRLSRGEYANVIYDLLGVHFDVRMPGALNVDPRWQGFDRIGSVLSLSPSHVNRYLAAAETVLEQAFPVKPSQSSKQRQAAEAPHRWLLLPGWHRGNINIQTPGLYRIRVQLSAVPSFKGRLPRLSVWNNSLKRAEAGRDVISSEDEPTVVEIEAFLPRGGFRLTNEAPGKLDDGHTLGSTPNLVTRLADVHVVPKGYKLFTDEAVPRPVFPMMLVDWIEYEGPLLSAADQEKRSGLLPAQTEDVTVARDCLARFMARAWRRPPSTAEVDRYLRVFESEVAADEDVRAASLSAMAGVMTSKNFYYLVEGTPSQPRDRINDWELASRLSFFLWSSLPDKALFDAARKGELQTPRVLKAQLARLLADRKAHRFVEAFPRQWLQLHRVGMFPPDRELYPDYDKWLEQSMIRETVDVFGEVFAQNLSICEFLSSDWTVLNSRLAMHYDIDIPVQAGFRRVQLAPDDHRGGVLTHASVLSLTSDGTRQRPVHRGVWVSEAIFGHTPPSPPPNVEPLEPTPSDKPKATIRDQLETHATQATCASCHRKIDPLGFAFDNYDAIGRWRTTEKVFGGQGDDPAVKANGLLSDGRGYSGPEEFKQILVADLDRFAEAFVKQLATFALRRVMTIDDHAQIKDIVAASKPSGYRLRTVVESLVLSDLFQIR